MRLSTRPSIKLPLVYQRKSLERSAREGGLNSAFSPELRCPIKTITLPTLFKTTPPEPMLDYSIRLRAYELYAQRGMAEGHAVEDWLAAEAELLYSHSTSDSNPGG